MEKTKTVLECYNTFDNFVCVFLIFLLVAICVRSQVTEQ